MLQRLKTGSMLFLEKYCPSGRTYQQNLAFAYLKIQKTLWNIVLYVGAFFGEFPAASVCVCSRGCWQVFHVVLRRAVGRHRELGS